MQKFSEDHLGTKWFWKKWDISRLKMQKIRKDQKVINNFRIMIYSAIKM